MNNKKNSLILMIVLMSLTFFLLQKFSFNMVIIVWIFILMYSMAKKKNHFITLLLVLEMMSLTSIFMISVVSSYMNSISMLFILMTLSVGEAVLGLAILVKLMRWSSTEFMLTGLN